MSKKRKRARNHRGMQAVTLCISTTMVLVLLGMVVFFVLSYEGESDSNGDAERQCYGERCALAVS